MTVLAVVPRITVHGVAPLVRGLDGGAGGGPILVLLGAASPILVIVELGTSVALATQPGGLLAGFCLVVGQHVGGVQPLGVVVQERPLLVQAIWSHPVILASIQHFFLLPRCEIIINQSPD